MKRNTPWRLLFFCCCLCFTGCETATPQNYFDRAVLNSNMVVGFANKGLLRQLESTSITMDPKTGKEMPMNRIDVIKQDIRFLEEHMEKLNNLKPTTDSKEMLQASIAMYEYVMPVYKNEYVQLADMFDRGQSKEQINAFANTIHARHAERFDMLYKKLISVGKQYAARHNIVVNWND